MRELRLGPGMPMERDITRAIEFGAILRDNSNTERVEKLREAAETLGLDGLVSALYDIGNSTVHFRHNPRRWLESLVKSRNRWFRRWWTAVRDLERVESRIAILQEAAAANLKRAQTAEEELAMTKTQGLGVYYWGSGPNTESKPVVMSQVQYEAFLAEIKSLNAKLDKVREIAE